jgi:hypothetical protein
MRCAVADQLVDQPGQFGAFRKGAQGDEQDDRELRQGSADGTDRAQRRRIGPMQVFDCQHDGRFGGQPLEQRHRRVDDAKTEIDSGERDRIGDDESGYLGALRIGRVGVQPECLDQRSEWAVLAQLVGSTGQDLETLLGGGGRDLGKQPRLPDAGLALHDGGLTGALAGSVE